MTAVQYESLQGINRLIVFIISCNSFIAGAIYLTSKNAAFSIAHYDHQHQMKWNLKKQTIKAVKIQEAFQTDQNGSKSTFQLVAEIKFFNEFV